MAAAIVAAVARMLNVTDRDALDEHEGLHRLRVQQPEHEHRLGDAERRPHDGEVAEQPLDPRTQRELEVHRIEVAGQPGDHRPGRGERQQERRARRRRR